MEHTSPGWLSNAIFYEIYPQSFQDSNADGIGDLQGIIRRLDYIRDLGCNAIWMNPCFDSPFGDAGYDIRDYYRVAPRYGSNEDLRELFSAVHSMGMHIILDLVPGHTSYQHPWFQASMQAEENPYTHRYVWTDNGFAPPPEGFQTLRGISDRNGAAVVNFFSIQPALNYGFFAPDPKEGWQQPMDAPGPTATRQALQDIMRFWLGMGCDGFRVDMAGSLVKNDPDGRGTIALWRQIRSFMDMEFPEAVLVSEWGEPDKAIAAGFDMDFLLHFGPSHFTDLYHCETPYFSEDTRGSAKAFFTKYRQLYHDTHGSGLICMISGNHDMERMSHYLSDAEQRLAFTLLLTMPGAPFIYYGDEIGMRYQAGLPSKEGGFLRTGARTPMQWDYTPNAGFSSAPPYDLYLPVDNSPGAVRALTQQQATDSLRSEIAGLIRFRQAHRALQSLGDITLISDDVPLIYTRSCAEEVLTVIINPSDRPQMLEISRKSILYTVGGSAELRDGHIMVPGVSAVILA